MPSTVAPTRGTSPRQKGGLVLSNEDREHFRQAESVIEAGLQTYVEVGQAIAAIRDNRWWEADGYASWDDYMEKRWGIGRRQASRMIRGSDAVRELMAYQEGAGDGAGRDLPTADAILRLTLANADQLARIESVETRATVLRDVLADCEQRGVHPTEDVVRAAVNEFLDWDRTPPPPSPPGDGGSSPPAAAGSRLLPGDDIEGDQNGDQNGGQPEPDREMAAPPPAAPPPAASDAPSPPSAPAPAPAPKPTAPPRPTLPWRQRTVHYHVCDVGQNQFRVENHVAPGLDDYRVFINGTPDATYGSMKDAEDRILRFISDFDSRQADAQQQQQPGQAPEDGEDGQG